MIIRDGRNVEHDLGPRKFYGSIISLLARDPMFRPMPVGGSWRDESSRTWIRRESRATPIPLLRLAYRARNPEHVRDLDRIRSQRRRDRQKASTAA